MDYVLAKNEIFKGYASFLPPYYISYKTKLLPINRKLVSEKWFYRKCSFSEVGGSCANGHETLIVTDLYRDSRISYVGGELFIW